MRRDNLDTHCGGFTLHLSTCCGTPLLAGGLCIAGYEEQSRRDLLRLSEIKFQQDDNIYDIDFKLAKAVRESCGTHVWAVGVSAALPGVAHRTGGIIGSPRMNTASATATVEHIGHGLYMRTFPGGPGCVALCSKENFLESWEAGAYTQAERADALANYLSRHDVKTFFVVADGTGPQANGIFILEAQGKRSVLKFD